MVCLGRGLLKHWSRIVCGAARLKPDAIIQSLELAAERGGDITPLVYANLFARFPDMQPLFVRDTTGAVRGEMLSRTIDAILDYLNGDHYATNLIRSESVTHDGYGVPPETFSTFYGVLAATIEEVLGNEWTPAMAEAWHELLDALAVVPATT